MIRDSVKATTWQTEFVTVHFSFVCPCCYFVNEGQQSNFPVEGQSTMSSCFKCRQNIEVKRP